MGKGRFRILAVNGDCRHEILALIADTGISEEREGGGTQIPSDARRAPGRSEGPAPGALAQPETDQYQTKGVSL
ncbi:hypothetical protein C8N38_108190 [Rhodovulum kholense]|uniref:Uncharacterized protein n=3 Tax=Rhodovulum TaxID=34008 RepID=A0A8E3AQA6_9RHOB|nr:hypothetical protein [Rhodovulum viride]PTW48437.1 hypothetical protein C8N38_108190 [Rhodovulum kholense]RAP41777.1 hypothetical protein BYZ73_07395 [Rhodovulum viride]